MRKYNIILQIIQKDLLWENITLIYITNYSKCVIKADK